MRDDDEMFGVRDLKEPAKPGSQQRIVRCAFTRTEAEHLWNLLWDNKRSGEYYGPREQYWKRHDRICDKLHAGASNEKVSDAPH